MNDIIRTQNLCKHYKETIALDNVSLHIPEDGLCKLESILIKVVLPAPRRVLIGKKGTGFT